MARKYLDAVTRIVSATKDHVKARDASAAKQIARNWVFSMESKAIPERAPVELWPGLKELHASVRLDMQYTYELPYGERALLDGIVRIIQPRLLFEFGTFTGATTVLLADAAPAEAVVHTIDLPDSWFPSSGFQGWFKADMVGRAFLGDSQYEGRIVSHRVDIKEFDFAPFGRAVDFVFIDAGHSYEDVLHDSRVALRIVAPGGLVVWDDYQAAQWSSVRALNTLAKSLPLVRLFSSRLVVHQHANQ